MADLVAIQQVLHRYCYAHDSQDGDMLATCFAKDVELLGTKGRDAVVATYLKGYSMQSLKRRHVLTNHFILEDGENEAVVQSVITLYLIDGDKESFHLTGIYRDRVIKEDGEW